MSNGCRRKGQESESVAFYEAPGQPIVRVLLKNDTLECTFSCAQPIIVTTADTNIAIVCFEKLEKAASLKLVDKRFELGGWACSTAQVTLTPEANSIFTFDGKPYRGKLKLVLATDGNSFDVVNAIGLEPYLAGVIGAEMPSYWEPQALEAQAIAARTYCIYTKNRFGTNRHWDVRRTAANQMYKGVEAETKSVRQAVNKTAGKVLVCELDDETKDVFPTYYGSSCGGHTEDSKNVFGEKFVPLGGVQCGYCKKIAKKKVFNWSDVRIGKAEVQRRLIDRYPQLKALEGIKDIRVKNRSEYKDFTRLTRIELKGNNGKTDTLRAEDFRLAIDPTGSKIKSAAFELNSSGDKWIFANGRGFGHGVGLCQCGAQGQARKGKKAGQILDFYYPGSRIKKIY